MNASHNAFHFWLLPVLLCGLFGNLRAQQWLTVADGNTSSPFYTFKTPHHVPIDISTYGFQRGQSYVFLPQGVSTNHPFMIGEHNGDMNSSLVSVFGIGGNPIPLVYSTSNLQISIPSNYNGDLVYFSTSDSSVHYHLKIVDPPGGSYQSSGGGYQSGGVGYQTQGSSYQPVYDLNVSHITALATSTGLFDAKFSFFNDTHHSSGSPEIRIKLMLHSNGQFQPDTSLGYYIAKPNLFPTIPDLYAYLTSINLSPVNGYTPPLVHYQSSGSGYQSSGGSYQSGGSGYQSGSSGYQSGGSGYQSGGGGYQSVGSGHQSNGGGYQSSGGGYQSGGSGYQSGGGGYQSVVSGYQSGGSGYQSGGSGYQSGGSGYQSGGRGYQSGGSGYQSGSSGYQSGGSGYQTPWHGYHSPGGGYQSTGDGYQSPGGGYQPPVTGIHPTINLQPYVGTVGYQLTQSQVILSGEVLETTESSNNQMAVGFFVANNLAMVPNSPGTQKIGGTFESPTHFSATVSVGTERVLYFRAYAEDRHGIYLGNSRKISIETSLPEQDLLPQQQALSIIREGTIELAGGWRQSSWFGNYLDHGNGWIYHLVHGWLYMVHDGKAGIWAWSENRGWAWSNKDIYPFLYQSNIGNWIYLLPASDGKARYFNYSTNLIEKGLP